MPAPEALTPELASRFARLALANVAREYPNKLDHVLAGPEDVVAPRALHPAFFGSFDWHSCVHAHWLLARILKTCPELAEADAIRAALDATLAPAHVEAELAYLRRPEARAFERSYGWAWLLKLAQELARWNDADARRWSRDLAPLAYAFAERYVADARRWSRDLAPLAYAFAERYVAWLAEATYPIRHGVHTNTAFALAFALDYARDCEAASLRAAVEAKARAWYLDDVDAPAGWEPSGADFFSPALIETDLMRRVLDATAFGAWLARFLPGIERREPATLFAPVAVSNRADPYIVHLDGLNLSRAWCWRAIAAALPVADARVPVATAAARAHLDAGLRGVGSGEYVGDHWLATFAAFALSA